MKLWMNVILFKFDIDHQSIISGLKSKVLLDDVHNSLDLMV